MFFNEATFDPWTIFGYAQRFQEIEATYIMLCKTGYHLICYWDNKLCLTTEAALDDPGIFYYIPLLAQTFNLSPAKASFIFYYGLLVCSAIAALTGFYLIHRSTFLILYGVGTFYLLASKGIFNAKCVYAAYLASVFMLVPWCIFFIKREKVDKFFVTFLFLAGMFAGFFHTMRFLSSIGAIVFIIASITLASYIQIREKVWLIAVFLTGLALPSVHINAVMNRANQYVTLQRGFGSTRRMGHTFWHTIYASFGFLKNDLNLSFEDGCPLNRVKELAPDVPYWTHESDAIIQKECINLLIQHPLFVFTTIFAKLGVCLFIFLVCANVGIIGSMLLWSWREQFPFLIALLCSTIHGMVSDMTMAYMVGFSSLSFLYGIFFFYRLIVFFKIRYSMWLQYV